MVHTVSTLTSCFAYAMVVKGLLLALHCYGIVKSLLLSKNLSMMEKMCILESLSYRLDGFVNCNI